MVGKIKVVIDPSSRILYSSFYIQGLYNEFGKENVSFSGKYFTGLKRKEENRSYDHYMAFVVIEKENKVRRFIIDFRDKHSVKESAYHWCDRYAKINFNKKLTDEKFHDKIVSIPPGFGIRIWNFYETVFMCLGNYVKSGRTRLVSLKAHLADYYTQYKRPSLKDYDTQREEANDGKPYIFMIATLWKNANCIEGTNLMRRTFIEVCKSSDCEFEGGFFSSPDHPQFADFAHLIFTKRYSTYEYIEKIKKSAIVFNTPAVHNCHGWKLGEYLAMGKAIISTPLSNDLPESMKHGKNIHFVSDTIDFMPAIRKILIDRQYQNQLENGARDYYLRYATPGRVIKALVSEIIPQRNEV